MSLQMISACCRLAPGACTPLGFEGTHLLPTAYLPLHCLWPVYLAGTSPVVPDPTGPLPGCSSLKFTLGHLLVPGISQPSILALNEVEKGF